MSIFKAILLNAKSKVLVHCTALAHTNQFCLNFIVCGFCISETDKYYTSLCNLITFMEK